MGSTSNSSLLTQALAREETYLRTLMDHEAAALLDTTTGKIIWRRVGQAQSVEFSSEDIMEMPGNILTHNHPAGWLYLPNDPRHAGSSFSSDDVAMLVSGQLAEIRAVSPSYLHILRPPMGDNLSHRERYFRAHIATRPYAEVFRLVEQMSEIVGASNSARINSANDPFTVADASANHWHRVMELLVLWWGVHYERKEWQS